MQEACETGIPFKDSTIKVLVKYGSLVSIIFISDTVQSWKEWVFASESRQLI